MTLSYQATQDATGAISIVGIGGAGANILRQFSPEYQGQAELFCAALDSRLAQGLEQADFIQLGSSQYHGMGTGGDPELGRRAAEENAAALSRAVNNKSLVVLLAGLGGGTGSGICPYLAQMAREQGAFVVSILVMPFDFEGPRRREQAQAALEQIRPQADLVLCFENDAMESLLSTHTSARDLFRESDKLLAQAAACVPMIAADAGFIHLGLDDLRACLTSSGEASCLFGFATASGENRAHNAALAALQSPLMQVEKLAASTSKLLVHITGDASLRLAEIREVLESLRQELRDDNLDIIFGCSLKKDWSDTLRVSLLSAVQTQEPSPVLPPAAFEESDEIELVALQPEDITPPVQEAVIAEELDETPLPLEP